MSTDNPKVSGYVPQHIYDRFKNFCEERGISMSQAVTVIFAEYFGLDLSVKQNSSTSRPLVERVGLLEQELVDLRGLVENHLELRGVIDKKEHLVVHDGSSPEAVSSDVAEPTSVTPSEPLREGGLPGAELPEVLENVEVSSAEGDLLEITPSKSVDGIPGEPVGNSDLPEAESSEILENAEIPLAGDELVEATVSEPLGSSPDELLEDNESPDSESVEVLKNAEVPSAEGNLPSKQPRQDELSKIVESGNVPGQESFNNRSGLLFIIPGEPVDEIKPIPGIKLSKLRFGLSEAMVAGKKRDKPLKEFTQWTKDRDPDHIAWKYVETPSKGYLPVDRLSSELRDKLLIWIRENGLL